MFDYWLLETRVGEIEEVEGEVRRHGELTEAHRIWLAAHLRSPRGT